MMFAHCPRSVVVIDDLIILQVWVWAQDALDWPGLGTTPSALSKALWLTWTNGRWGIPHLSLVQVSQSALGLYWPVNAGSRCIPWKTRWWSTPESIAGHGFSLTPVVY